MSVTAAFVALLVLSGGTSPAADVAPPSTVSQGELDAALARQHDQRAADRDRVRALLQREELRALAEGHGLDLKRAESAVETLGDSELRNLAQQVATIESGLQGGDVYVRLSLIALLLIIIIVILLAD
jgi:hypothetical protein